VNWAWEVRASVATIAFAIVVEPFTVVPTRFGTTHQYELPRKLQSASWAVLALDHRYPTYQNHWGYSVLV
jgi:hypothetical protein